MANCKDCGKSLDYWCAAWCDTDGYTGEEGFCSWECRCDWLSAQLYAKCQEVEQLKADVGRLEASRAFAKVWLETANDSANESPREVISIQSADVEEE